MTRVSALCPLALIARRNLVPVNFHFLGRHETEERAAERAIAELNGKSLDGRCIKVKHGF